ncbi:hypothetical protein [Prochlorococcus sp. MIT 1300]|uniref:hypothetical protein n=1 Tax=Prochlorococcus sp. MIT 1300 TaxID=3096218 RepID=UPI002A748E65|nr:hypothetical protein [Prochlorococcus sp. MIT 1300]
MQSIRYISELCALVASAADVSFKPWVHAAVVVEDQSILDLSESDTSLSLVKKEFFDLTIRVECRDREGKRYVEQDLELEIYRSGKELNLMLSWLTYVNRPILWHGQHPIWMDGATGERCTPPKDGSQMESFSRRLRALLMPCEEDS